MIDFSTVLYLNITSITTKHSMSNIVLMAPKVNMNFMRLFVSHFFGFTMYSGSTLSKGIPTCARSQSMFWMRMWIGSIGRNGRIMLAIMTESMLPKLPLVASLTYLRTLVNVLLPFITPSSSTLRSFSRRIMPAVSFAMSTAVSTEMPTSACFRGGESLMPSPMYPTVCPIS